MTLSKSNNSAYRANGCGQLKNSYKIWHNRLGYAPAAKIKLISQLQSCVNFEESKVCLTCPMTRFKNISFSLSSSHAENIFDLVHADI